MTSGDEGPLADELVDRLVLQRETVHAGMVWDVVREQVDLGDAGVVTREFVAHTGAVGCVALDDQGRVLLLQQYRHPTRILDWELPAGLLDVAGEPPWEAASRELYEEADLRADTWHVLADWQNSPGGSSENWRCFLARGLSAVADEERFVREHEEADIVVRWVPLQGAVDAVLAGRLHNACTVAGVLAAHAASQQGWATLRPYDAPWPEHPAYR
ncbi:NUDIX domain-containing protein [Luteipulveratus halotolerans]|uniref:ADP-ribose pyrophosphatase n=1 Tax=Luteipulveratus halotolerans TaxID=1631356 RepID=A0A0L6CHZ0_9MICO|nr:NUDIX hydrolase [Luteipulveratus halotolerans]KNX37339.1 ADP-ribose pyrophosphatase [Luteipulveratus halotolerans]